MKFEKIDVRKTLTDYFFITLGTFITAASFVIFIVPFNIVAGGVSGLSLVFNYLFHWWIGAQMLVYNMILFALGFKLLGIGFGVKSIYSSVTLSLFIDFLQQGFKLDKVIPEIIKNNPGSNIDMMLLCAIYAGLSAGLGIGLVIWRGATTGGTDIIAMIMNKYFHTSVGTGLIIADTVVTSLSLFINPVIPMYGVITIFATSKTIDGIINGLESTRTFIIISDLYNEIKEEVYARINRGVTFLKGTGTYTNTDKNVLLVTVSRNEIGEMRKIIKDIDPKAFTVILPNSEALGYGFKKHS